MDAHRYQQVKTILADLLERPENERAGLLTARCGQDADLRAEIESLLVYESDDDFLEPGEARDALMRDRAAPAKATPPSGVAGRRMLKIVASRDGKVVWTDRVPHDTDTAPGANGVISIPPFEIQLSIETVSDAPAAAVVRTPRAR